MLRACLASGIAGILALLAVAAPVTANHAQTDAGRVIVFDHAGGNEWWVEAQLAGQDGGQVASLWVAEYPASSSMWKPMAWNADWGKWTASTHVTPGHPVKFRALWDGGAMQTSCWFSHPGGAEACGGTGNPTPLDATFTLVTGNEWWVQAQVTPNQGHAIDHVEVRIGAGDWKPLPKASWGQNDYAASYRIVDGTLVQFRASDTNGLSDLSSCYRWIPPSGGGQTAAEVPCSEPTFRATYSQVKGNEWWAEAVIVANQPVTAVGLRVDCQLEPEDMVYKAEWGKWVLGGVRIPAGSKVTIEANFDRDAASGGYVWPQATPTSGCPVS
jgi:hypothetical protein